MVLFFFFFFEKNLVDCYWFLKVQEIFFKISRLFFLCYPHTVFDHMDIRLEKKNLMQVSACLYWLPIGKDQNIGKYRYIGN